MKFQKPPCSWSVHDFLLIRRTIHVIHPNMHFFSWQLHISAGDISHKLRYKSVPLCLYHSEKVIRRRWEKVHCAPCAHTSNGNILLARPRALLQPPEGTFQYDLAFYTPELAGPGNSGHRPGSRPRPKIAIPANPIPRQYWLLFPRMPAPVRPKFWEFLPVPADITDDAGAGPVNQSKISKFFLRFLF